MKVRCRFLLAALLLTVNGCQSGSHIVEPPVVFAPRPSIPTSGEVRALIVFVSFADDTETYEPRTAAGRAWPTPGTRPTFAADLLDSESPSSLTSYFRQQSNGRFHLVGEAVARPFVTTHPESEYAVSRSQALDRGKLTEEILQRLDADPSVDLSKFDANRDGWLDYLFVVLRRTSLTCCVSPSAAGIADLGTVTETRHWADSTIAVSRRGSGSYVHYRTSGIIFPEIDLVRLMAHEFGHHLFVSTPLRGRHLGGLPGMGSSSGDDLLGYALMVGNRRLPGGQPMRDARGDATLSAFERDLVGDGWIDCATPTSDTTLVLRDLYTHGDCARIPVGNYLLYLSNRQRLGPFDRVLTDSTTTPPNDHGLADTGLLAMIAKDDAMAVLPADDSLALSIAYDTYDGDLFKRGQLTPWTRPALAPHISGRSMSMKAGADSASVPLPMPAIVDIRQEGGVLFLDYVHDFLRNPVVRSESWIDGGSHPVVVPGPVRIESILHVRGDVRFGGDVDLADGGALLVADEARVEVVGQLRIARSARLAAPSTFSVHGRVEAATGATIDWKR